MTKRISIDQLKSGMYVVGIDKSWWQTPFLSHKWAVQGPDDIAKLRDIDVREVVIDLTRGCDVDPPSASLLVSEPPIISVEESDQNGAEQRVTVTSPSFSPTAQPVTVAPASMVNAVAEAMPAARAARDEARAILEGIFEGVKIGKPIDSPAIKTAVTGLMDNILHRPEASLILMQMQRFEADLLSHAIDVCVLSLLIGKQQELSPEQLEVLGMGAMLHDVGKTRLPRNLLRKSNGYSPQAQKLLNEHPRLGVSLLAHNKDLVDEARRIIAEHHERADGSGFPEGRPAARISPLSQIVSVVNIYDGFVSGHNGRAAHLPTQALRRLYQMGRSGQLLTDQVIWAIRALGIYPIGAIVEVNTGERGIVVSTNAEEALKPIVQVIADHEGQPLLHPRQVDLALQIEGELVDSIVRPLDAETANINVANYFREIP